MANRGRSLAATMPLWRLPRSRSRPAPGASGCMWCQETWTRSGSRRAGAASAHRTSLMGEVGVSGGARGADPLAGLDKVSIMGLSVRGRPGGFAHERADGQGFVVDAGLWVHARPAAAD